MAEKNPSEVTFSLGLNGDSLDVRLVRETLGDIEKLLADIERHVVDRDPKGNTAVHWFWGSESRLDVVASVNGVSKQELEKIVSEAQEGFEQAERAAHEQTRVRWPETFGNQAQNSARRILRRLENLESIVVRAGNRDPVIISAAEVGQTIVGRKVLQAKRRFHASVQGKLELISHRGKLASAIRERGNAITCTFPDEMLERFKDLFDKNVIAEGMVSYRDDGTPISITEVSSIEEKPLGKSLIEFIGAAPDLTGGLSVDDFFSKMRGHGN
jgi:hypothetical protein